MIGLESRFPCLILSVSLLTSCARSDRSADDVNAAALPSPSGGEARGTFHRTEAQEPPTVLSRSVDVTRRRQRADATESAAPPEPFDYGLISSARRLRICEQWSGHDAVTRIAHYDLIRDDSGFSGEAVFQVGRNHEVIERVVIPAHAATSFLKLLSKSPVIEGTYEPNITTWYESTSVGIELDETVIFYSESQGQDHVPWGVRFHDRAYTLAANTPARALFMVRSYLKSYMLDALWRTVRESKEQPTPSPSQSRNLPGCPSSFSRVLEPQEGIYFFDGWAVNHQIDPATGRKTCELFHSGLSDVGRFQHGMPSLPRLSVISRSLGGPPEVQMAFPKPVKYEVETKRAALIFLGDGKATLEEWEIRHDGIAVSPHPAELFSRLRGSKPLFVVLAYQDGTAEHFQLTVGSVHEALEFFDRCRR